MKKLISFFVLTLMLSGFIQTNLHAEESVCAVVKIEIKQELTLERQAFDAKMKITNGLDTASLDNVKIDVSFKDEDGKLASFTSDPGVEGADFYIRLDDIATSGITAVDGTESIPAASAAEIHWLIIPAPGSGGEIPSGKLYYVGAKLTYNLGADEKVVEVSPDAIYVKPMPMLELDYFLTEDVYADDSATEGVVEPAEPFTLGVRIKNNGSGIAKNIKIDSAQPKIIENDQGLLIGFEIISSYLNDSPAEDTLLINFGDIESNTSKVGRWVMQTTLSGKFTAFEAQFTHAEDLGGKLTSLIDLDSSEAAHLLIKDVIVDLPGKDSVKDFLAKDGDVIRVYESDAVDTDVVDHSAPAVFSQQGINGSDIIYTMQVPATAGPLYAKVADPLSQTKKIKSVIRQDGKLIPLDNAWLSKTKNDSGDWEYFFNLFDANSEGQYTVIFTDEILQNSAPVIQFISQQTVQEGSQLGFLIETSDQDGTIPTIQVNNIPAGATYTDQGNGKGEFSWTPLVGQKGRYQVEVVATDSVLTASRIVTIQVNSVDDADGDGIADSWENENFGDLVQDGSGDADGDGYSDLEEYINQTDPNMPEAPVILEPANMGHINVTKPNIRINRIDSESEAMVSYRYEIYSDQGMTALVDSGNFVSKVADTGSYILQQDLEDNTWYFLRVKVTSLQGTLSSSWTESKFFIDETNNAPNEFLQSLPEHGAEVVTLTPQLQITNTTDPDEDDITYSFEVYNDLEMVDLVMSVEGIVAGGDGTTEWNLQVKLENHSKYYWRALAVDSQGAWTATQLRIVNVEVDNTAPGIPDLVSPAYDATIAQRAVDIQVTKVQDPDGDDVKYYFQIDKVNTFDSASLVESEAVEVSESYENVSWVAPGDPDVPLDDNTMYYWRVRVEDANLASSDWSQSRFFINTVNDAPTVPTIANPGNESWVDTITPILEVNPSTDVDRDSITYEYDLKTAVLDYEIGILIAVNSVEIGESAELFWQVEDTDGAMIDNEWYAWRARAKDQNGATSDWTEYSYFFTNSDGVNDAPTITISFDDPDNSGEDVNPNSQNMVGIIWTAEDPDNVATIALYYDTDSSGEDGIMIVDGIAEISDNSSHNWDTSGMEPGIYYAYAVITDDENTVIAYSSNAMEIIEETVVIFDNQSAEVSKVGTWEASTYRSGFYGADYNVANLIWAPGATGIVVDNSDPEFSYVGDWGLDTRFNDGLRPAEGTDFMSIHPHQPSESALIIDNDDAEHVTMVGDWSVRDGEGYGANNTYSHPRGDGDGQVTWSFNVEQAGMHKVYLSWEPLPDDKSVYAPYTVNAIDGAHEFEVNQWGTSIQTAGDQPSRIKWYYLGTFEFDPATEASLTLKSNLRGSVVADAMYVEHVDATPNHAKWTPNIPEAGRYQVHAWWPRAETESEHANFKYTVVGADQIPSYIEGYHTRGGGTWRSLGTYEFAAGDSGSVTLSDRIGVDSTYTEEKMFADAIKFIKVPDQPKVITWTISLPKSGTYNLYTQWPYDCGATGKAKYTIESDAGQEEILFKQNCLGSDWYLVGTYSFTQGQSYQVSISDEFADARTYADAIKFERLEEQPQ